MSNSKSHTDEMILEVNCASCSSCVGVKCFGPVLQRRCAAGTFRSHGARTSRAQSYYKHFTPTEFITARTLGTAHGSFGVAQTSAKALLGVVALTKYVGAVILLLAMIATSGTALAQTKKKTARKSQPTLNEQVAKAKNEVIAAANDYKASLQALVTLQENDVKSASDIVEKRKALLAQSVISKKELEDSERALSIAQTKASETKRQIAEADNLIAEAKAEEQLARLGPSRIGAYQSTAALIRYNGPTQWVLSDAAKVESFFASKFHHALPVSAYGQTAVHDQLGFDHHNSVDVAVSPDSAEGQELMAYLRGAGIPFIAFRYAVRGSATGAHIHIGYPSRRLSK